MDEFVDGVIAHRDTEGIANPLADGGIGGEAIVVGQAVVELVDLLGCEGGSFAGRHIEREEGWQATIGVAGKPSTNGIAIEAEVGGNVVASLSLATGQQVQGLQALILARVTFLVQHAPEVLSGFVNHWSCFVHPSRIPS